MICPYMTRKTTTTNPITGVVMVEEEPMHLECMKGDCPYCKSPYSYRPKDICHKIADEYEQKGW